MKTQILLGALPALTIFSAMASTLAPSAEYTCTSPGVNQTIEVATNVDEFFEPAPSIRIQGTSEDPKEFGSCLYDTRKDRDGAEATLQNGIYCDLVSMEGDYDVHSWSDFKVAIPDANVSKNPAQFTMLVQYDHGARKNDLKLLCRRN